MLGKFYCVPDLKVQEFYVVGIFLLLFVTLAGCQVSVQLPYRLLGVDNGRLASTISPSLNVFAHCNRLVVNL